MGVFGSSDGETLSLASSNASLRSELGGLNALGPGESTAQSIGIIDIAAAISVVGDGDLAGGLGINGILPNVEGVLATAKLTLVTIARVVARGISGLLGSYLVTAVADSVVGKTGIAEGVALADRGTLFNSHVVARNRGAHDESGVPVGVAALTSEGGESVGTRGKLIVGGSGERGQRQGRGGCHDRPVEGHAEGKWGRTRQR